MQKFFDVARIHNFARNQAKTAREDANSNLAFQEALAYWDSVATSLCMMEASVFKQILQALLFSQERELSRAQEADSEAYYAQREVTEKWVSEAQESVNALKELLARA